MEFIELSILIDTEPDYIPKAEYVFRTFCTVLKIKPIFYYGKLNRHVDVYYGSEVGGDYPLTIRYNPSTYKFFQERNYYRKSAVIFNNYKDEKIPFLFSKTGPITSLGEDSFIINKDIIASSFYFLSCWKEHIDRNKNKDESRFDYFRSIQYEWGFTEIPVVDAYIDIFDTALDYTLEYYHHKFYWKYNKKFCLSLSHDIDYYDVWSKDHYEMVMNYNKERGGIRSIYKRLGHFITKKNFNREKKLRKLLAKEERYHVRSTSFILTNDEQDDKRRDYFSNPDYKEELKNIFASKDIGLHGSLSAAFSIKQMKKDKDKLFKAFPRDFGYRTHRLNFEYQESFNILKNLKFKYDSTLGYWEHIGFRAGISFPFYPYDIEQNRPLEILEIPLVVMDVTMLSHKAMNLNPFIAYYQLQKLMQTAMKFNSHISILWHNNTFDFVDFPFWGTLYWYLIKYALKKDGWVCSLDELYDFWKEQ